MTTLHLLRTSAFSSSDLSDCIDTLSSADDLVLLDDACYNVNHPELARAIDTLKQPIKIIDEHAKARGLELNNQVQSISLSELVQLTFIHTNSITWQS